MTLDLTGAEDAATSAIEQAFDERDLGMWLDMDEEGKAAVKAALPQILSALINLAMGERDNAGGARAALAARWLAAKRAEIVAESVKEIYGTYVVKEEG